MDAYFSEWSSLLLRWVHIVAGIMWIGDSLLFMWMDKSLKRKAGAGENDLGELWMVHGGGFYHLQKKYLAPHEMPPDLHAFKWEATSTWVTGFLLLWVVYYFGGILVDPVTAPVSENVGIAVGLGFLVLSWAVYDGVARLTVPPLVQLGIFLGLFVGSAYGLSRVFTGRAMFLHIGAAMGTCMVANVWMRILPAQRSLLSATKAGQKQDPTLGARAKKRSWHNNLMTYPVIAIMVSNHFPTMYGHELNWLVLTLFFVVGAGVRHHLNEKSKTPRWLTAAVVAAVAGLAYLTLPAGG